LAEQNHPSSAIQVKLYKRIQPYEDAGVPKEYYDHLLYEEMELLELEDSLADAEFDETGEDFQTFRRRYEKWKTAKDKELRRRGTSE
jgi:hypothetical protein